MNYVKLKNIVSRKITDGPHISPDYVDVGVPFISGSEISGGRIVLRDGTKMISEELHDIFYKRTPTRKNDILLVKNGSIGNCAFVDIDLKFSIWVPLALIRVKDGYDPKYVYYTIISEKTQHYLKENASETAQPNLSISTINNILVKKIDIINQIKIAEFLDEKCYNIESEVSFLEKKVTLLDEYKNSLIYETVTKGLSSNSHMKDSGIDFIGEIPSHWKVKRVKDYYKLGMGSIILKDDLIEDGLYPVYSATSEDKFFGYVNDIKIPLKIGDLVIPARGSIGFVKRINQLGLHTCTQTTIYAKNKSKYNNSHYYYYYMMGNKNNLFEYDQTAIPQITVSQVKGKVLLVPPLDEQIQITNFLNENIKKIEKQVEIINKKVKLLKEYKQSLIYEAVTGHLEIE